MGFGSIKNRAVTRRLSLLLRQKPIIFFLLLSSYDHKGVTVFLKSTWIIQGVPNLQSFHYRGSHCSNFWLLYALEGDFCVSRGPTTVPLMHILRYGVFFKSQNPWKSYFQVCLLLSPIQWEHPYMIGITRNRVKVAAKTRCPHNHRQWGAPDFKRANKNAPSEYFLSHFEVHALLLALNFSMKSLDPLQQFIIGVACKELVRRRTNLVCITQCKFSRFSIYWDKDLCRTWFINKHSGLRIMHCNIYQRFVFTTGKPPY